MEKHEERSDEGSTKPPREQRHGPVHVVDTFEAPWLILRFAQNGNRSMTYIHGTSPEEQRRLSLMNDVLLNPLSLRELALRGDERIIDFGSGLGQFTCAMARAVLRGGVVGIERSDEQRAKAVREANVVYRAGDVLNLDLGNEWGTFDVAHARFVLEHVPDSLRVVQAMVRAVKPGG